MPSIQRFLEYAAAFEKAFASDDWTLIEPYFADDVVYEVPFDPPFGGRFEGRRQVVDYLARVTAGFDRRFASREVVPLEGPSAEGHEVRVTGRAIYRDPRVPELSFDLEERLVYEGDRIARFEDDYSEEMRARLLEYLERHAATLGITMAPKSAS